MRLQNAPLVHVLAQVVFAPVLAMAEHIATIQGGLAGLGLPRLAEGQVREVAFGGVETKTTVRRRWEFLDRDQRVAVVLTETYVVLQTSDYESHEAFLGLFERVLAVLQSAARPALVDRIGFRFIDYVRREPGERFSKYVHEGLLGFPFVDAPELHANLSGFATQSVAVTPVGTLAIRSALVPPGQFTPPDLDSGSLLYPAKLQNTGIGLIVDFDHFTLFAGPGATPFDFESAGIIAHLRHLHLALRDAFRVIATADAIERWSSAEVAV